MSNRVTILVKDKLFSPTQKTYKCGAASVYSILGAYVPEEERGFCFMHIQTLDGEALTINHPNEKDTATLSRVMQPGETLTILKMPQIFGVIAAVATFIGKHFAIISAIISLAVALYALFISFNLGNDETEDDPTVDGGSNRARRHGSCVEIFGKRRIVPPLAANEYILVTKKNQHLKNVYDFGVGKVTLEDEKIGAIPLEFYEEVQEEFHEGTWDGVVNDVQTVGSGLFQLDENGNEVDDQRNRLSIYNRQVRRDRLFFKNFAVRRGRDGAPSDLGDYKPSGGGDWQGSSVGSVYTATHPTTQYIIIGTQPRTKEAFITIDWIGGLYTLRSGNHDRAKSTLLFIYRKRGTSQSWRYGGWLHIDDSRSGRFQEDHRIIFPEAATWEIRIWGWEDSKAKGGRVRVDDFQITELLSVREETNALNTRRDHAIKELSIKATDQLQGTISSYSAVAQRHLPIPTGSSFSETDANVGATSSPAAAALYMLRQHARITDDTIDFDSFKDWHDWCEEEIIVPFIENNKRTSREVKRAQYNDIISSDITLKSALERIGNVGNASILFIDNSWKVIRMFPDKDTPPEYLLTEANTNGLEIVRQFPKLHHAIQVKYIEPLREWEESEITVFADGYEEEADEDRGIKKATLYRSIDTAGVTSRANAARLGRIALAQAKLRNTQYKLNVGMEGLGMYPGQIVRLALPEVRMKKLKSEDDEKPGVDERIIQGTLKDTGGSGNTYEFILDVLPDREPFNHEGWSDENAVITIGSVGQSGPVSQVFDGHVAVDADNNKVYFEFEDDPDDDELPDPAHVKDGDTYTLHFKSLETSDYVYAKGVNTDSMQLKLHDSGTDKNIKITLGNEVINTRQLGIDCIVRSVQYNSDNFTGQVVLEQAALIEFDAVDIGEVPADTIGLHYGTNVPRFLNPPPYEITQAFVLAEVHNSADTPHAIRVEYEEASVQSNIEIKSEEGAYLTGDRNVGSTLTINTDEIQNTIDDELERLNTANSRTDAAVQYGWTRDGIWITQETENTYELVERDEGTNIQAFVFTPDRYDSTAGVDAWEYTREYPGFVHTPETSEILPNREESTLQHSQPEQVILEWAAYDTELDDDDQTPSWRSEVVSPPGNTRDLPIDDPRGTYVLRIRSRDIRGNVSPWSDRYFLSGDPNIRLTPTVVIDDQPNEDSLVIVDHPHNGGRLIPVNNIPHLDIPEGDLEFDSVGVGSDNGIADADIETATLPSPSQTFWREAKAYFAVPHKNSETVVEIAGGRDFHDVRMQDADYPEGGTSFYPFPGEYSIDKPYPIDHDTYNPQEGWVSNPFQYLNSRTASPSPYKNMIEAGTPIHIFMTQRLLLAGTVPHVIGNTEHNMELGSDDNPMTPNADNSEYPQLEWSEPVHVYDLVSQNDRDDAATTRTVVEPDAYTVTYSVPNDDLSISDVHLSNPFDNHADHSGGGFSIGEYYDLGIVPPGEDANDYIYIRFVANTTTYGESVAPNVPPRFSIEVMEVDDAGDGIPHYDPVINSRTGRVTSYRTRFYEPVLEFDKSFEFSDWQAAGGYKLSSRIDVAVRYDLIHQNAVGAKIRVLGWDGGYQLFFGLGGQYTLTTDLEAREALPAIASGGAVSGAVAGAGFLAIDLTPRPFAPADSRIVDAFLTIST